MIVKDLVFEPRRYRGLAAPPATLEDASRYRTNLALAGTAAWAFEPGGIWALELDGNSDYASLVIARWRDVDGAGSIEAWVKPSSLATTHKTIFATSDTGTDTNFLQLRIAHTSGFLEIVQRDGAALNQITGDVSCAVDTYWHVVVTGDTTAGAYILYVNSVVQGLTVTSGANTGNWFDAVFDIRNNITVGAWINNSGTEQYFDGFIEPPNVFRYVLTPGQVAARFTARRSLFGV